MKGKKERETTLMASNNMQFTVQASAVMCMCYVHVWVTKFKEHFFFFQLKALIGKL